MDGATVDLAELRLQLLDRFGLFQLDAAELDGELHDVLRNRVTDIFKYFKVG